MVRLRFAAVSVFATLVVSGCAAILEEAQRGVPPPPAAGPVMLTPWLSLQGARVTVMTDPTGLPLPQGNLPFVRFVQPTAVAARANELYIADAGLAAIYRFDIATNTMARVPAALSQPGVQLELAQDRTLLVVDGASRRVTQIGPAGRIQDLTASAIDLGRPVDVVADDLRGRILIADGILRQVLAFHPAGRAFQVLPLRAEGGPGPLGLAAIAVGPRGLYLLDPLCRCVLLASPDGRLIGALGRDELEAPAALAADSSGRLYVADNGARALKVYIDGKLGQTIAYRSLAVTEITDLKIADGALYIADGPGARVEIRRIASQRFGVAR